MSQPIATLQFHMGTLEIIDFPQSVEEFHRFPDGRIIIAGINGERVAHHFFRVYTNVHNTKNSPVGERKILEATMAVHAWARETYGPDVTVQGKSFTRALHWAINPVAASSGMGPQSAIIGGPMGEIKLAFPRGINFRTTKLGMTDRQLFEKDVTQSGFLGYLKFAGSVYRFKVWHRNIFDWCDPILAVPKEDLDERIEEAAHYMPDHITKENVVKCIEAQFKFNFPWAIEHNLLSDITIDADLKAAN